MKEPNKVFNIRRSEEPTPTYTKKQVAKYLVPWGAFATLMIFFCGMLYGWYSRVDFEATMQQEVSYRVEQELKNK